MGWLLLLLFEGMRNGCCDVFFGVWTGVGNWIWL